VLGYVLGGVIRVVGFNLGSALCEWFSRGLLKRWYELRAKHDVHVTSPFSTLLAIWLEMLEVV
jgi:uncharacterized membrane protein YdjX (TVP38/TMEM64 family)